MASVVIYRNMAKDDAGTFFIGAAFAVTILVVSELGLRGFLMRELARVRDDALAAQTLFRSLLTARLLLVTLSCPVLAFVLWVARYPPEVFWCGMGLWLFAACESISAFIKAALRSYDRMKHDALFSLAGRGSVLVLVWALATLHRLNLPGLIACFTLGPLLEVAGLWVVLQKHSPLSTRPLWNSDSLRSVVIRSLPLGVMLIISTLYYRTGVFVLSKGDWLSSSLESFVPVPSLRVGTPETWVAEFNAAGRLPDAVNFLPVAMMNALLPFLTRNQGNPQVISTYFNLILKYLGLFGVAASGFLLLEPILVINMIAGPQYQSAAPAFQVYGATVFFSFLQYAMSHLIICLNMEKLLVRRYAFALVVNIVLGVVLVPIYGVTGAAVAYLAGEMLAGILDLVLLNRLGFSITLRTLATWCLPAAVLLLVCKGLPINNMLVRGGGAILATSLAIGALGLRDWRRMRQSIATP